MTYLVFDTQEQAKLALTIIWSNIQPVIEINAGTHEPVQEKITKEWAIEQQRLDGKWIFLKPEQEHMTNVTGYIEEEYSEGWFNTEQV